MKSNVKYIFIILVCLSITFLLMIVSDNSLVSQDDFFGDDMDGDDMDSEFDDLIEEFISSGGDSYNPLSLSKKDVKFTRGEDSKYIDLYVRKRDQINSVLVIYVVVDKRRKFSVDYGLRALEYNTINGDEIRVLNGVELGKEQGLYFLVDSTPEKTKYFDEAFRIRIPVYSQYGYTKENFGLVRIEEGTRLKIRAFELPYADYNGSYHDSSFIVSTVEAEAEEPREDSDKPKVKIDTEINNGEKLISKDGNYIVQYIRYEDNSRFFKDFLYKEYLATDTEVEETKRYRTLTFKIEDEPEEAKAVLLASIYQNNRKLVKAKVFFEIKEEARKVRISARDEDDNEPTMENTVLIEINRRGDEDLSNYKIDNLPGDL